MKQHRHWMRAKSLSESKASFVGVIVLLFVGSILIAAGAFVSLENLHSGANQGSFGIGQTATEVWIANASGDYKQATFSGTGNSISITTPANFTLAHMVVFTKNPKFNLEKVNNGSYYNDQVNVSTTVTGGEHTNLTGAWVVAGQIFNSTSVNAISDKAIQSQTFNQTIYSSSVNRVNLTNQLSLLDIVHLVATPGSGNYIGYVLNFNTHVVSSAVASTITVKLYSVFSQDMNIDFYVFASGVASVFGAGVLVLLLPRSHIDTEEAYREGE